MAAGSPSSSTRRLLVAFLLLTLVGLGVAIDLTVIHVRVHTEPAYRSFCAISREVNCDTVAESHFSVFLGLPVSVWGMLGYLAMAFVALTGLRARRWAPGWPAGTLLLLSGFSVLASLPLAVISKTVLNSVCLMCVASWTVNLGLFVLAVLLARGSGGFAAAVRADARAARGHARTVATAGAVGLAALAALWIFHPRYWESVLNGPGTLATGVTESGEAWIGARAPKVTIVEFSDYQCGFCLRAHQELRQQIQAHPDEIRLVHHHYPLDQSCNSDITRPFHEDACNRAKAAVCAGEQGKFWQMNDALYRAQASAELDIHRVASRLGLDEDRFRSCLGGPQAAEQIKRDLEAGRARGVRGTPTFFIGDKQFVGRVAPEEIEKRLKAR